MSTDEYDLVVISASPAGQVTAELAAAFGRRALVVEQNQPGGVVTTTGGAPTKALREAALYLTGFRQQEVCGIRAAARWRWCCPSCAPGSSACATPCSYAYHDAAIDGLTRLAELLGHDVSAAVPPAVTAAEGR